MRRVLSILVATGVLAFAAGGANAANPQPGCQAFGQLTDQAISASAKTDQPLGQEVSAEAPVAPALAFFRSILCG